MDQPAVALICSASGLEKDPDLELAEKALADSGYRCTSVRWDDPAVDWERFTVNVVRSCWDYSWRREEFLAWAGSVPRLHNPLAALQWSSDKRYLRELADRACDVVPTVWNPDDVARLPAAAEWVVKPAVSAGSRNTARWSSRDEALEHVRSLRAAGATAMVQPYVASVDDRGETALLFIGGRFSHAVRKGPLLLRGEGVRQDRDSRADLRAVSATTEQRALARSVLAAAATRLELTAPLLYARVDIVAGDAGPLLLELELVEPSLFLPQDPAAPQRLVAAIAQLRS